MKRIVLMIALVMSVSSAFAHKFPTWTRTDTNVPVEVRVTENATNGTVIFAHGCNGPAQGQEPGWAERLQDAGFNVVSVNSWQYRNISGGVCTTRAVAGEERTKEIGLVIEWINKQDWHTGKVFLLGWSHSATTALAASTKKNFGLAKAVAIYPGCERRFNDARIPVQIHIGAADDWTPASYCRNFYKGLFSDNPLGEVFEYADAYHAYDFFVNTDSKMMGLGMDSYPQLRTQRSNPEARELTITRVIEFFKN